jgi:hypothetical protein
MLSYYNGINMFGKQPPDFTKKQNSMAFAGSAGQGALKSHK